MNINITNYYMTPVLDKIEERLNNLKQRIDDDYIADVACVALNQLPPRYVKFKIDTSFYMTSEERAQTELAVCDAVTKAMQFVDQRRNTAPDGNAPKYPLAHAD